MNRQQKIQLLRGIQNGAISLNNFKPKRFAIDIDSTDHSGTYFINGNQVDGLTYSNEIAGGLKKNDEFTLLVDGMERDGYKEYLTKSGIFLSF